jgi:predicted homoserine dehydrogenase-like protein
MLNLYKLGPGPLYSFYTPYHLCHFEVPLSAARVALFRDRVLSAAHPMVEVITLAKEDLAAGDVIDAIGGYKTYGQCENYSVSSAERLLPMGLAHGCRLKRDIGKDRVITYDDVEIPPNRLCDQWRAEQDRIFFSHPRPIADKDPAEAMYLGSRTVCSAHETRRTPPL